MEYNATIEKIFPNKKPKFFRKKDKNGTTKTVYKICLVDREDRYLKIKDILVPFIPENVLNRKTWIAIFNQSLGENIPWIEVMPLCFDFFVYEEIKDTVVNALQQVPNLSVGHSKVSFSLDADDQGPPKWVIKLDKGFKKSLTSVLSELGEDRKFITKEIRFSLDNAPHNKGIAICRNFDAFKPITSCMIKETKTGHPYPSEKFNYISLFHFYDYYLFYERPLKEAQIDIIFFTNDIRRAHQSSRRISSLSNQLENNFSDLEWTTSQD